MVDQTTRGHQFLVKNFGADARPKGTWSIDPFGHSNTQAWLLGAESAMEFMFWGRTDYQDMRWRTNWQGQKANQWPEWIWQGSQSLGASAEIFAGQLGSGGYGTHIGWDGDGGAVQDNPERHDYNLDEMVDQLSGRPSGNKISPRPTIKCGQQDPISNIKMQTIGSTTWIKSFIMSTLMQPTVDQSEHSTRHPRTTLML